MSIIRIAKSLRKAKKEKAVIDSLKKQYADYRKKHPNTELSETDFIKRELDKRDTSDTSEEGAMGSDSKPPTEEEREAMSNYELDDSIDLDKLRSALDSILDDQGSSGSSLVDKLERSVDFLTSAVDIDQYVMGLPDDAKRLANYLKERQEKLSQVAQKSISEGASYKDYIASLSDATKALSQKQWETLRGKEVAKSQKALSRAVTEGKPFEKTYSEYVKSQKSSGSASISKAAWGSIMEKARKTSERKLRDSFRKKQKTESSYEDYVERKEAANEVPVEKSTWEQIVGKQK